MRCESAQRALSGSLDERVTVSGDVRRHTDSCPACTEFAGNAWRLRELVRFEVAPPVPDLVPAIMAAVREETASEARQGWRRWTRTRPFRPMWQPVAAAAVAGLLVGAATTAGGLLSPRRTNTAALAEAIPRRLVLAAVALKGYRATFDITELHWTAAVARRTFVADLAFRAPEDFRVQVRDTTRYPSSAWPANDLLLVTDGRAWRASGPDPCPSAELPACPSAEPVGESTIDRPPFDPRTAMPTDVIVPMTVLAAADRVDVVGPGRVADRAAVRISLSYEDASPLFDYLRFLGSWRPFYPQDRVEVWLDRQTWFPLRYEVYPSPGPERAEWASGVGLPPEPPGRPVFSAIERTLSTTPAPASAFEVNPTAGARDEGFHDAPGGTAALAALEPSFTAGLSRWRYGSFARSASRPFEESVLAYSKGLAWLTVTQVLQWNQRNLFGVGPFAEPVGLPGGRGLGYFEPATRTEPRRLALHTQAGEFLVGSNLPREEVIRVAASLPVTGLPQPSGWRIDRWSGGAVVHGLTPGQAMAAVPFPALVPTSLPPGVRPVSAEIQRTEGSTGITVVFRRSAAEIEGDGIQIHQAVGETLPPPSGADQAMVPVQGVLGRWSPQAHLLEWLDHGIYRSVWAPGLDLGSILRVANSLRAPPGAA